MLSDSEIGQEDRDSQLELRQDVHTPDDLVLDEVAVILRQPDRWWIVETSHVVLGPFKVLIRIVVIDLSVEWVPSSDGSPEHLVLVLLDVASHEIYANQYVEELADQYENDSLQEWLAYLGPLIHFLIVIVLLYFHNRAPKVSSDHD